MLKKTTLAILSLAVSGFASAGTMGPVCTPGDVTVPCEAKLWDLGAQALYLQPTYSADKGYVVDPAGNLRDSRPSWGWAYRIEGSYHFHTGNDITMTLLHYDIDTQFRNFVEQTAFALAPVAFAANLENKFDQVNIVLGQHTDMGTWKKARFYGGLQYAKIRADERNTSETIPPALFRSGVSSLQQYRTADFWGVGPTFGTDYSYDLVYGFSVTGNTAVSLLYGTARHTSGFVLGPQGLIDFPHSNSRKTVVPSLEAKLGLKYVYPMTNGVLNFEGGYQTLNYFNALESRRTGIINSRFNASNFGLYGPYLGAKWIGNV